MKPSMLRYRFQVLAAILLFCFSAVAQQIQDKPPKQRLAVEVSNNLSDQPWEILVVDGARSLASSGADVLTADFKRIKEWKASKEGEIVRSVNFKNGREGDVVIAHVSVTMENEKVVAVGTYRLREGESAKTVELTKFGIEALVLKVIKATPVREEPFTAIQPKILNKTKALEVESFYPAAGSSQSFQLTLKNVSNKNIVALDLLMTSPISKDSDGHRSTGNDKDHPLIAPGGVFVSHIGVSSGGTDTSAGYVPDPVVQRTLIIRTVVFDDGAYDGQVGPAAEIEAGRRGQDIQRKRILSFLREQKGMNDVDVPAVLNELKEQTYALSQTADASVVIELKTLFPSLNEKSEDSSPQGVEGGLRDGLRRGKLDFVRSINDFEEMQKRPGGHITFAEWIKQTKANYEKMTTAR